MSNSPAPLDAVDETIVAALRRDGRQSIPALAEEVGISRATAYTRFDRLCDSGVITGFTARVDPASVGLDITALVLITIAQADWRDLKAEVTALPHVEWTGMTTGAFDFVVLVRARDLAELRDVVLEGLLSLNGIQNAQTVVVLDEAGDLHLG
jgi:DNA-binding Lrp family transcriptional regulator